jgi:hypothetical protein
MLVWDETLPFSATHVSKMLYRFTMLELYVGGRIFPAERRRES